MKPGIDAEFWKDVHTHSEKLFYDISKWSAVCKRQTPDWHEIQIWCADMWAVLWNLWKRDYQTIVDKDLNFTWGTSIIAAWDENPIYHNAGVTKSGKDENGENFPFYKSEYMDNPPIKAERPADKWASQKYFDLVVKSWNDTVNQHIVVKKVVKKQIVRKRV